MHHTTFYQNLAELEDKRMTHLRTILLAAAVFLCWEVDNADCLDVGDACEVLCGDSGRREGIIDPGWDISGRGSAEPIRTWSCVTGPSPPRPGPRPPRPHPFPKGWSCSQTGGPPPRPPRPPRPHPFPKGW